MPRDIKREADRKLYLAGASRQQVMKKHRAEPAPKPKRKVIEPPPGVALSKAGVDRMERDRRKRMQAALKLDATIDKARLQTALDEWDYLNRS